MGKLGMAGVYTDQRLNLSMPWEGPLKKCQGFKPDPGNLAVRHYRGASRNVCHGETVNPPAIERAGPETPHLQRGALDLYPNRRHHSKPGPRHDPTRPLSGASWGHEASSRTKHRFLRCAASYFQAACRRWVQAV